MFHIVSLHRNAIFPGTTFCLWHYSKLGHNKDAIDGVGGTQKRVTGTAVAEGQDIVNSNSLKDVSLSSQIVNTITAFCGIQRVHQFGFTGDVL